MPPSSLNTRCTSRATTPGCANHLLPRRYSSWLGQTHHPLPSSAQPNLHHHHPWSSGRARRSRPPRAPQSAPDDHTMGDLDTALSQVTTCTPPYHVLRIPVVDYTACGHARHTPDVPLPVTGISPVPRRCVCLLESPTCLLHRRYLSQVRTIDVRTISALRLLNYKDHEPHRQQPPQSIHTNDRLPRKRLGGEHPWTCPQPGDTQRHLPAANLSSSMIPSPTSLHDSTSPYLSGR